MSELIQCILDSGIKKQELEGYLPTGQKLSNANVAQAVRKLKEREGKISKRRLAAEAANMRLAVRTQMLQRSVEEGGMGMSPQEIVKGMMVRDLRDRSNHVNVEGLAKGYQARINMSLDKAAESFRPTMTGGTRDAKLVENAVRVMGGEKAASNEAAIIGAALKKAFDTAHRLLREAGGEVGYITNYMPQTHTMGKLRDAGQAKWKSDIRPLLDRQKMTDSEGVPLNDQALDELLDYIYMSITTEGRSKLKPPIELRAGMGVSLNSGTMSRVLHFQNPDAAMKYNKAYGNEDLWGTMTNQLHGMAMDAAVHKTFGPAPELVYSNWRDWATKADTFNDTTNLDHIWHNVVGFNTHGETRISAITNSARDLLSSAYMGSAVLASIPDTMLVSMNAAMNGMNVPRMLARAKSYADAGDRELLSRTAGNIEYSLSTIAASSRFEDTIGKGLTHRLSDATYRISGMTGWMNGLRHAWLTEFQTMLGTHLNKPYDELPKEVRGWLDTYGLNTRWDEIRQAKTQDFHGSKVVDFSSLEDDHLIAEVLGAVYTERDLGILHPDARVRALLNQGKAPGGFAGELLRSATQFKTFAATVVMHGVWRYMMSRRLGSMGNRAAWTATMLTGMAVLGGIALQLREMAKGRDPMPMDTKDFFLLAFAQGGAVPGLAELWMDGQTRYGAGWIETALGPTGGALETMRELAYNGVAAAAGADGASEKLGKAVESATYLTPGNNIWWGRAAVHRLMRDALMDAADPNYRDRQLRSERNRRNEYDQDMWWGYDQEPEPVDFSGLFGD